jgi:hypothetical protein
MNAQKFQLRYSQVEDRILIIVTDDADQDEVFGLTRRLVKRLVPGLEKVLRQAGHLVQPQVPEPTPVTPGPTPAEAVAFSAQHKQKAQPQTETATSENDESSVPAPVAVPSHLVTRLRVTDKGKGQHLLQLTDGVRSLGVPLNDEQLAQFSHGIVTVLKNADWGLDATGSENVDEPSADTGSAALDISADSPSKYRH